MYCDNCGEWYPLDEMLQDDDLYFCDDDCLEQFWESEY